MRPVHVRELIRQAAATEAKPVTGLQAAPNLEPPEGKEHGGAGQVFELVDVGAHSSSPASVRGSRESNRDRLRDLNS